MLIMGFLFALGRYGDVLMDGEFLEQQHQ